ncbi:cytochrome-c peroxidase [Phaeocystidibacter luteus]|uniref:Cytochrome-c peroxidase n=1 Tax=Phaeocystidibacter luteus TaxID=911197 RepID=A0A6N6RKQ3_9FLAO|nr:cytochrome c peroxidase [Phaeocystidibacter luteus]KAB2808593.1 cytochrome-c peroxidase [Phaeocystidibacter luteus]
MKLKFVTLVSVTTLILVGSAFQSVEESPVEFVSQTYTDGISSFAESVSEFQELALERSSNEEMIASFEKMRTAYKEIEYLVFYADAELVLNFINGAPLPHLEPKTSAVVVMEPQGLQRMEELVYEREIDWEILIEKSRTLTSKVELLERFSIHHSFSEREILEAVRFELIRVLSQGVTGFDTPASDRAILESAIALNAAKEAMYAFESQLMTVDPTFAVSYLKLWEDAVTFLESNPDFETFDRATFTVEFIEPLFQRTLKAQEILYIEFKDETSSTVQSINYRSKHIFSEELINPFFYTMIREGEYTEEKVELGRALFFDPILSSSVERSCASCHRPDKAFTDGLAKSTAMGFDGTVDRNAPTLVNAVLSPRYFYDLRAHKLEEQFDHVIFNPKEFNTSYADIVQRLGESEEYRQWFERVYGENARINKRTVETALASYIISLRSFDSPVDKWLRGEGEVTEEVKRGYNLFMGKAVCGTCHFAPTFAGLVPPYFRDMETEVLGVPVDTAATALDPDRGRAMGLLKESSTIYDHSFKTLTVRNAELTAPYMHNGVFESLEEVVDFYNRGGGTGRGLDVPNQTLPFDELKLSVEESADLVAFMRALTSLPKTAHAPEKLPSFDGHPEWNDRAIGGEY